MFWYKKKNECDHRWFKSLEINETELSHIGGVVDTEKVDVVYIYCPKCNTRKRVTKKEWTILEKEDEIYENWVKKGDEI